MIAWPAGCLAAWLAVLLRGSLAVYAIECSRLTILLLAKQHQDNRAVPCRPKERIVPKKVCRAVPKTTVPERTVLCRAKNARATVSLPCQGDAGTSRVPQYHTSLCVHKGLLKPDQSYFECAYISMCSVLALYVAAAFDDGCEKRYNIMVLSYPPRPYGHSLQPLPGISCSITY